MPYKRNKLIIRISIAVVFAAVISVVLYFIYDINYRFPNTLSIEKYTKDNPAVENGLEITPVSFEVYTYEEYHRLYPDYTSFDYLKEKADDTYRILTFNIRYFNTTDADLEYETDGYTMVGEKSGMSNGVISEGTTPVNTIAAGETQEIMVNTVAIAGSIVKKEWIEKMDTDTYSLVYWWYPVHRELVFG